MEATSAVVVVFVNLDMEGLTVRSLLGKVSSNMSMCAVCSTSAFSEASKTDQFRDTYHGWGGGGGWAARACFPILQHWQSAYLSTAVYMFLFITKTVRPVHMPNRS